MTTFSLGRRTFFFDCRWARRGSSEHFQDGHRIWVAALAGAPHAMAADRGRGAEAGTGRAVKLTCHCRKLNPAVNGAYCGHPISVAVDAVDEAHSAAVKCHRVVAL